MSDDKTEEPSEHKLEEARKKGEVVKSQDVTMAVSMLGVFMTLMAMSTNFMGHLREVVRLGLDFGNGHLPMIDVYRRIGAMVIESLWIILPLAIVAALFAVIGVLCHVGLVISMEPIMPKPDKLNPAEGIKKVFSIKSILTFIQMVMKAAVLGIVIWQAILQLIPLLAGSAYQSVGGIGVISWEAIIKILKMATMIFLVFGPLDYAIQYFQFMKGQRMSKDEVKREHKNSEGDPQLKGERKQLAKEMIESDPKPKVAGASAVVVNPTHYAVAIRYRPENSGLPIIVAKGLDEEALRIRGYAEENAVPIFANPQLARTLHQVPLNMPIPEETFETVAAILRWVDDIGAQNNPRPLN
jgi:type III secretion protein U